MHSLAQNLIICVSCLLRNNGHRKFQDRKKNTQNYTRSRAQTNTIIRFVSIETFASLSLFLSFTVIISITRFCHNESRTIEFYSNFPSTSNQQSPQNAICIVNSLSCANKIHVGVLRE